METNAKPIIPAVATHPGTILKKELKARGIKQKDFAAAIGMPAPNLCELIKGKRNVTESIALKLEEVLGIPFQNWMNLQNRYFYVTKCLEELDAIERKSLEKEQELNSKLNLRAVYKYYGISFARGAERIAALEGHCAIDLKGVESLEATTRGYFKRSDKLRIDEKNLLTWLFLARAEASKINAEETYSNEKGLEAASQIAGMANNGTLTPESIKRILNNNGIIYLHIPKLDAAPIDAYSMMSGEHPAIVVTYRHNDLDKLAFDVLHEIGHICLHIAPDKSYISIENEHLSASKEEREADKFANDLLIPPSTWHKIMSGRPDNLSPHIIVNTMAKEAQKNGISPSIAVARFKHETRCYNLRGYRSPKIIG